MARSRWQRTVTYEVVADSLEEALELWDDDGPECALHVAAVDSSNFELGGIGETPVR